MPKELSQIEAGDKVWVRDGQYGRTLRTVVRLTRTQIILDGLPEYSRFERGKTSSYTDALSYNQIGRTGFSWVRIDSVATPAECEAWEAEQKAKAEEAAARKREEDALKAKQDELNALFTSEGIYVHRSHDERRGEWHVNITCSEDEVRRLAVILNGRIVEAA